MAVLSAALGGCANGKISDQDTARGTVETFLAQCAAGRGTRVIETLNPSARTTLIDAGGAPRGCSTVLGASPEAWTASALRAARVRLTAFDGSTARFVVRPASGGTLPARVAVTQVSNGWQIEGPS
ncbi:MAG TPA: hypothetical protein VFG42_04730 [Baekduia sp.]|uniref:hypothetical protein n=1 Tax=Baekduia sp. TaxID=2600305 RepID=UPI002D77D649|nr:hypothetical protein [Baekduia sp.]HET6506069.1 hypothetical protein [Baekduia sp.]